MTGVEEYDDDPVLELAAELRQLKEASGLSFSKLQSKIPYSRSALQRYLSGVQPPPRDAVIALCEVCGGDVAKLTALRDRITAAAPAAAEVAETAAAPAVPDVPAATTAPEAAAAQARLRVRALRAWGSLAVVIGLIFLAQHTIDKPSGGHSAQNPVSNGPADESPRPGDTRSVSFPDASTTGVPKGTVLKQSGSVVVTTDNATIQDLEVHGSITVYADNVTIKDVRVLPGPGDYWGIDQKESHAGLTVEHTEVRGNGKDQLSDAINNDGGMITVKAVDLSRMDKGVETQSGLIADSYIHDPGPGQEHSSNAIAAGPIASNLIIRHNTLLNSLPSTAAILMGNGKTADPVHDVTVERNYLAGGAYSLYGGVTDAYPHGSYAIVVRENVFSRCYFPHGGYFAPNAAFDPSGRGNVWRDNVWAESQEAVLPS
ncbi:MAG: helix-turn-helix domain-containing protein [Catenulispora sp.]|nr:helix-turn-helix domain-containing protein [Catenulispora sp.]